MGHSSWDFDRHFHPPCGPVVNALSSGRGHPKIVYQNPVPTVIVLPWLTHKRSLWRATRDYICLATRDMPVHLPFRRQWEWVVKFPLQSDLRDQAVNYTRGRSALYISHEAPADTGAPYNPP
eukprot:g35273.t1